MTKAWEGGKTYVPGSLVIPTSSGAVEQLQPENAGFETGDLTGWVTTDAPHWTVTSVNPYEGTYSVQVTGSALTQMHSTTTPAIRVGQSVSVSAKLEITNSGTDDAHAQVALQWLDDSGNFLPGAAGVVAGNEINGKGGSWKTSTASGVAPPGAAKFTILLSVNPGTHGSVVNLDATVYTYAFAPPNPSIVYKATQAGPAKSASTEPNWPGVVGVPITDGGVTWEGELATRVVWTAHPLAKSSGTEPDWPQANGGTVHDGTIDWVAQSAQVTDPNCPHSKIVAIAASKVYVGDNDIIRFCATVNPLDWTSPDDAGFLDFGLQTYGSNPIAAMNLYRSNIVPFNAEGFQMWQVDTDPANITLLDALPVASTYNKALTPVANDLIFLSSQGVRSVGIAASSTNLQAGDVGMPIDVLVKPAMVETAAAGDEPLATFLPALGQVWISFNAADRLSCTVFVYTLNQIGQVGKWSRYVFPFPIDEFTMLDDQLFIRSGDGVLLYDETALNDCEDAPVGSGFAQTPFPGIVQWPWLDMQQPGVPKMMVGFDLVTTGADPSVAIGYNEANTSAFTTDFTVPADTVPGMMIPLCVMAPSLSVRISYPGGARWKVMAANLYLQDQRTTS